MASRTMIHATRRAHRDAEVVVVVHQASPIDGKSQRLGVLSVIMETD